MVLFILDVANELTNVDLMTALEAISVLGLMFSVFITLREYRRMMQRNQSVERRLDAATGAFSQMMSDQFTRWGLTAAERDVALMSVKGVSIGDIAALRQTATGTVKAQSAAIYRKAGVSNRAEMISVLIEDMIEGVPLPFGVAVGTQSKKNS
ncbi:hypothetical protein P775_12020 [Puniceibacterium antarcticum]|uniref:HTH luxR-type domain-containing protein n=1 Tax=Puniceibacterium antarcticum TaxID=1206336 RepID=A0A2G8REG3_9RHOB|nr:helix-turn-helix transcriptional regulator [Puniceibacterium antarcticum]PIL19949.1 hypothetical protein P775_12020 [Puniceibacterium antarcticum]